MKNLTVSNLVRAQAAKSLRNNAATLLGGSDDSATTESGSRLSSEDSQRNSGACSGAGDVASIMGAVGGRPSRSKRKSVSTESNGVESSQQSDGGARREPRIWMVSVYIPCVPIAIKSSISGSDSETSGSTSEEFRGSPRGEPRDSRIPVEIPWESRVLNSSVSCSDIASALDTSDSSHGEAENAMPRKLGPYFKVQSELDDTPEVAIDYKVGHAMFRKLGPYYKVQSELANELESAIDDDGYSSSVGSFSPGVFDQDQEYQEPLQSENKEEYFVASGDAFNQRQQTHEDNWWLDASDSAENSSESETEKGFYRSSDMSDTSDGSSDGSSETKAPKMVDSSHVIPFEQQVIPWDVDHMFPSDRERTLQHIREWSLKNGFDIKVTSFQRQHRSIKTVVACHLAGKRVSQKVDNPLKRRHRESKLTGCQFRLIIRAEVVYFKDGTIENKEWILKSIRNEHNHEPSYHIQRCTRSAKRLSEKQEKVIKESVI
ncbi:hypothetical protein BGX27_000233 [Mortierella sp. AM989]|nr:hypothetical protein BGX27_000233 [Mortierella sp. AM989]